MSLELSDFDGDLDAMPAWANVILDRVLPEYEEEVQRHAPWLDAQGRRVIRLAFSRVLPTVSADPSKGGDIPQPRDILAELYEPVLEPFEQGALDEATKLAAPILAGSAVLFLGLTIASFVAGRLTASPTS